MRPGCNYLIFLSDIAGTTNHMDVFHSCIGIIHLRTLPRCNSQRILCCGCQGLVGFSGIKGENVRHIQLNTSIDAESPLIDQKVTFLERPTDIRKYTVFPVPVRLRSLPKIPAYVCMRGFFSADFISNLLWQNCFPPEKSGFCAKPRRSAAGVLYV